jgi:hypothetical protein
VIFSGDQSLSRTRSPSCHRCSKDWIRALRFAPFLPGVVGGAGPALCLRLPGGGNERLLDIAGRLENGRYVSAITGRKDEMNVDIKSLKLGGIKSRERGAVSWKWCLRLRVVAAGTEVAVRYASTRGHEVWRPGSFLVCPTTVEDSPENTECSQENTGLFEACEDCKSALLIPRISVSECGTSVHTSLPTRASRILCACASPTMYVNRHCPVTLSGGSEAFP